MRIGMAIPLLALPGGRHPVPRWTDVPERALFAEQVGFDLVLGIGAGTTPDAGHAAFGIAAERNWWTPPGDLSVVPGRLDDLARACEEVGRDPATLRRSLDVYLPLVEGDDSEAATVERIGLLARQGIDEVRCHLPRQPTHEEALAAIEALAGVVRRR